MSGPEAHPAPAYRIMLGKRDITPLVDARLVSLQLTECRGEEADRLDLTLSDHDGALEIPARDATLQVSIGWRGQGLVDKGTFLVDEVEHCGSPDVITLRARSAELTQALRTRSEHSYHATTLGQILTAIAARHKLEARIDDSLAAKAIAHVDQTNESDVNFVTRLARLHDAVATVKRGKLLFLPILATTTSTGLRMPQVLIDRASGDSHRFHTSDRDAYSGVRAYWHDPKRARRRGVLVGKSGNAKRLRDSYANEPDARAAAIAEWRRIQRGAATFELTLALGVPELAPQSPVRVTGFKAQIDELEWLAIRVSHLLGEGGFTTRVELENDVAPNEESGIASDAEADSATD